MCPESVFGFTQALLGVTVWPLALCLHPSMVFGWPGMLFDYRIQFLLYFSNG